MTQNGNNYIIVMQDHFTKWVEGRAICGKKVLTIADAVVQDWILKHGTPVTLHNDWGQEVMASLHQEVCDLLRITKTYSTAHCPQAKGMVERCNWTLLAMLQAIVSEQQDDWDDQLPALLSAYRSTPHSSSGVSPYRMLYGEDLVIGDIGREWSDIYCPTEYVEWLHGSIRDAHAIARTNLKKAAKRQKGGLCRNQSI